MWGWGWFSNAAYQLNFNTYIGSTQKLIMKRNKEACTSFKIELKKLPLTMPHPWANLLPQMPHRGEDKVAKCPTNAREGIRH